MCQMRILWEKKDHESKEKKCESDNAMEESGGKFPPLLDHSVDAIQMGNIKEKRKKNKYKRK